jgi:hypothetical protein
MERLVRRPDQKLAGLDGTDRAALVPQDRERESGNLQHPDVIGTVTDRHHRVGAKLLNELCLLLRLTAPRPQPNRANPQLCRHLFKGAVGVGREQANVQPLNQLCHARRHRQQPAVDGQGPIQVQHQGA